MNELQFGLTWLIFYQHKNIHKIQIQYISNTLQWTTTMIENGAQSQVAYKAFLCAFHQIVHNLLDCIGNILDIGNVRNNLWMLISNNK